MLVFVTGASGFLGLAVIKQLTLQGHQIRALVYRKNHEDLFRRLKVETVAGEICRSQSLDTAMAGCEAVLHMASIYAFYPWWNNNPEDLYRVNVEGTKNLCELALKHKVSRFVYTSSIAAIGKEESGKPCDENTVFNQDFPWSHYARSKFLAEQEVLKYCQAGLPGIILNPAILAGENDYKPTPSGEIILKFLKRKYPFYFDGVLAFADVDDVAITHVAALTKGRIGQRYILANSEPCSLKDLFALLEKISGVPAPRLKIPYGALLSFSYLDEVFAAFLGKKPLIATEALKTARFGIIYDSTKARKELNFLPGPLEETLRKAVAWYKENRYVKTK